MWNDWCRYETTVTVLRLVFTTVLPFNPVLRVQESYLLSYRTSQNRDGVERTGDDFRQISRSILVMSLRSNRHKLKTKTETEHHNQFIEFERFGVKRIPILSLLFYFTLIVPVHVQKHFFSRNDLSPFSSFHSFSVLSIISDKN